MSDKVHDTVKDAIVEEEKDESNSDEDEAKEPEVLA